MNIISIHMPQKLILVFLFWTWVSGFFSANAQCNPDLESPSVTPKGIYEIPLDTLQTYSLKAKELVAYVYDNCTPLDQINFSFHPRTSDSILIISRNSNFPLTIICYISDLSGNTTAVTSQVSIINCPVSLVCLDEVNIAVPPGKNINADPGLFLAGSYCADRKYKIEYLKIDPNTTYWTELTVINDQLPSSFQFRIIDSKTLNSCWGIAKLSKYDCDLIENFKFNCTEKIIPITSSSSPSAIGVPIDPRFKVNIQGKNILAILDSSQCSSILMTYKDSVESLHCSNPFTAIIRRNWIAQLPNGQFNTCTQIIKVIRQIDPSFPLLQPVAKFDCSNSWKKLSNGAPDPESSGFPAAVSSNLKYSFTDSAVVNNSNCSDFTSYYRSWIIEDLCTQTIYNRMQTIEVVCMHDTISPVAICSNNIRFDFQNLAQVTFWVFDFDLGSYDDCSSVTLSFDALGLELSKVIYSPVGVQDIPLTIYVRDASGNVSTCISTLHAIGKSTSSEQSAFIGGNVLDYYLNPRNLVNQFDFTFDPGNQNPLIQLANCSPIDSGNNYQTCIDTNYHITSGYLHPKYNMNWRLNGISAADIAYIMKYLFGNYTLNAYQKIAADVNCDDEINVYDLFDIRRIILGLINQFSCNSVQCYTTDPKKPQLLSSTLLTGLPRKDVDFVAVLKGDVNSTGYLFKEEKINAREGLEFQFFMDEQNLEAGKTYDLWLQTNKSYNLYAFQIGQLFDSTKISLKNIQGNLPNIDLIPQVDYVINSSDWRSFVMSPSASIFNVQGSFIKLTIQCLKSCRVSEAFDIRQYPIPLLVIDENLELAAPVLTIVTTTANKDVGNAQKSEFLLQPNPVNHTAVIKAKLKGTQADLKVTGSTGTILLNRKLKITEGLVYENVDEFSSLAPGVYTATIQSDVEQISLRFVKQ